jgi:hypothetical protein
VLYLAAQKYIASPPSMGGRVLEITSQLTAFEKERLRQQDTLAARLDDEEQLIETMKQQVITGH